MALIDQARAAAKTPGLKCAFGKWFDQQDPAMRAEVLHLLAAPDIAAATAGRVLSKESGVTVTRTMTARHRPGSADPCRDCQRTGRLS